MELTITITMDNDAFVDNTGGETARILACLSMVLENETLRPGDHGNLSDLNGQSAGSFEVK